MQVLYVVGFDVAPREEGVLPYAAALSCVSEWLTYNAVGEISEADLRVSGARELRHNKVNGDPRRASWELVGPEGCRALRVKVRDEDEETESSFITHVTLSDIGGAVGVRVSMGRETSATWLSPAPAPALYQPGIVRSLMRKSGIDITVVGQRQDGRYIQVRSDQEVQTLADIISHSNRLPLLLLHTRTLAALETAKQAAAKLVGLVRVVTLDYRASRSLYERLPG